MHVLSCCRVLPCKAVTRHLVCMAKCRHGRIWRHRAHRRAAQREPAMQTARGSSQPPAALVQPHEAAATAASLSASSPAPTAADQLQELAAAPAAPITTSQTRAAHMQRHATTAPLSATSQASASSAQLHKPAATVVSLGNLPLLEYGELILALLLNPTHELVRKQAVVLLKQLCLGTPHMTVKLVIRLAKLLPDASAAGMT